MLAFLQLRNWRSEKGKRSAARQSGGLGAQMPSGNGCTKLWHCVSFTYTVDVNLSENVCLFWTLWESFSLPGSPYRAEQLQSGRCNSMQTRMQKKDLTWTNVNVCTFLFVCVCILCVYVHVCLCVCDTATTGNLWWKYSKAIVDLHRGCTPILITHALSHCYMYSHCLVIFPHKNANTHPHTNTHSPMRAVKKNNHTERLRESRCSCMRLDVGWLLW